MFKKLSLSLTFAVLSIASSVQCSDRALAINSSLAHIAQERNSIFLRINQMKIIREEATERIKASLGDAYEHVASEVTATINTITMSEEFSHSIGYHTGYKVFYIIEQGRSFNDIGEQEIGLPILHRKYVELTKLKNAFPSLNEQVEQLFNISYEMIETYRSGKTILEKLAAKEAELQQELLALEASNHAITE
jgi:hypothetical protein